MILTIYLYIHIENKFGIKYSDGDLGVDCLERNCLLFLPAAFVFVMVTVYFELSIY